MTQKCKTDRIVEASVKQIVVRVVKKEDKVAEVAVEIEESNPLKAW